MKTPATPSLPIIEVAGTPYECGYQYGQQAVNLIQGALERYLELIEYHANLAGKAVLDKVQSYIPVVAKYFPDLLQEIQGISDGSGCSLEHIIILNCRTELLSTATLHECTSMAVVSPASGKGDVLLGQTWDWLETLRGFSLILKVSQAGKPQITMLVEAGQIGKMGYNSAGLGVCLNWLETEYQRIGVPYLLVARAMLNCGHINDAIDVFGKYPRASSGNYLLAHGDGFAINIEATPDQFDFQEPDRGLLVHSNHFLSAQFRGADRGLRRDGGDSIVRRQQAVSLLSKQHGQITEKTLMAVQQDRTFGSSAIYTVPSESTPSLDRWATLAGLVMNLTRQEYFISSGSSPDSGYAEIPN